MISKDANKGKIEKVAVSNSNKSFNVVFKLQLRVVFEISNGIFPISVVLKLLSPF